MYFLLASDRYAYGCRISARYRVEFTNAVGRVFDVAFISVCASTLLPFQCIEHPAGPRTTQKYREVLCWKTVEHQSMMGASVAILLMLLFPYLSACTGSTIWYPRSVLLGHMDMLHRYRFLFLRFKSDKYSAGLLSLFRSVSISRFQSCSRTIPRCKDLA